MSPKPIKNFSVESSQKTSKNGKSSREKWFGLSGLVRCYDLKFKAAYANRPAFPKLKTTAFSGRIHCNRNLLLIMSLFSPKGKLLSNRAILGRKLSFASLE
ncbi:hypothetical protein TNCV_1424481 [Trichonephila clavipes]|nr:hypothetical protein TNCV_1424481 [Trichonephila clavipes]